MNGSIYRFRPVRALLDDYHELERQEIYFAHPTELNDPLDGMKDVCWKGDTILWANLLSHYLLCVTQAVLLASINKDDTAVLDQVSSFSTDAFLPTDAGRELYRRTKALFFENEAIAELPSLLASRRSPIRKNELRMYLRILHFRALDSALRAMEERSLIPARPADNALSVAGEIAITCRLMVNAINAQEGSKPDNPFPAEVVGEASEAISYQQSLMLSLEGISFVSGPAWQAIISDFPFRYVVDLENLLYNQWYTACFIEDPTNAAMWGHYGDGHKGVGLKLKTHSDSGKTSLRLNQIIGIGGGKGSAPKPIRGDVQHELYEVDYKEQFVAIDFFRSMGQLTGAMSRFWYSDGAGNYSPLVKDVMAGSAEWRALYWRNLTSAITTKLKDWSHEKEVLHVLLWVRG